MGGGQTLVPGNSRRPSDDGAGHGVPSHGGIAGRGAAVIANFDGDESGESDVIAPPAWATDRGTPRHGARPLVRSVTRRRAGAVPSYIPEVAPPAPPASPPAECP